MRVLIVTVAGVAGRFNKEMKKPVLKCLYYEKTIEDCILFRLISASEEFDKIVIVGGFLFEHLKDTVKLRFGELNNKIILVNNPYYEKYGSGYSLFMGIRAVEKYPVKDIVFAEGDLYVDHASFGEIVQASKNVITINKDPILANKSVVFYQDVKENIHYLYDLKHSTLLIEESFTAIYNSAQIWKMVDMKRLFKCLKELSEEQLKGTNLNLIQRYFGELNRKEYEIVTMKVWFNCNTVHDYRMAVCHREEV